MMGICADLILSDPGFHWMEISFFWERNVMLNNPQTEYIECKRLSFEKIEETFYGILNLPFVQEVLNTIPNPALILNEYRQVVYANRSVLRFLNSHDLEKIIGKRPGELFNCIHSSEPSGCGTSVHCSVCGILAAFLECQGADQPAGKEARIMADSNGKTVSYDMTVSVSPFRIQKNLYFMVHMVDISHEKRRHVLERIFFHDILNTAANISSLSNMMVDEQMKDIEDWPGLLKMASSRLIEEIESQRMLLSAEQDELQITPRKINIETEVLQTVELFKEQLLHHQVGLTCKVEPDNYECVTDGVLLHRVLTNLVKNAIEASISGDIVGIRISRDKQEFIIQVTNPAVIPLDQQLQMFQRSFSTKGAGRGIGTYSIKLLTEKFLKGQVAFSSSLEAGTCFEIHLPLYLTPLNQTDESSPCIVR